jgi:hypothetical protein
LLTSPEKETLSLDLEQLFKTLSPDDIINCQDKIVKLQRKSQAIYQERGYKSLYLGVCFVRGYFLDNKRECLVNAPLFLYSSDFEKVKSLNLVLKSPPKVNYNLLYYLQKSLDIAKEKLNDFLSKLENRNYQIDD